MRRIKVAAGLEVAGMCLGTGAWGTGVKEAGVDRLYEMFREAGGDFFDSAHCYAFWMPNGDGASDRALGAAVRRHGDEGKVVVATKGGHPAGGPAYVRPEGFMSPERVREDLRESLERLQLGCVDLYYLHRDDRRLGVGEIMEGLFEEVDAGRVRFLGASNWAVDRIGEANAYAAKKGRAGFVVSQVQWSLAHCDGWGESDPVMRTMTAGAAAWYARAKMPVVAYTSTAGGYFASGGVKGTSFKSAENRARLGRAQELAGKLGVSVNQVALAWLMRQEVAVVPAVGTGDEGHLRDALGACGVGLSKEHVRWLGEA